MERNWYSKREVAEMTGYSEKTIDRALKAGWLRRVKNKIRRVRITRDSVFAFMQGDAPKGA
jgi:predicted site-specific integrase-resolvase